MDEIGNALATDLDGSFQTVVERIGTRLCWGLRLMSGDHQEAEDLTQETFIRAYMALGGYDRGRIRSLKLELWLWTIALNLGQNHIRDRARRPLCVEMKETPSLNPEVVDGQAWDDHLERLSQP